MLTRAHAEAVAADAAVAAVFRAECWSQPHWLVWPIQRGCYSGARAPG